MQTKTRRRRRAPLPGERVLRAARRARRRARRSRRSTMRKLGKELGVEAMSLYNHVADKEDLLDGIVDIVFSEIEAAPAEGDWKAAMRRRAVSARAGAQPPPLGDRPDGGPHDPRAGEPPPPRRGARLPARGRLLVRDDRARVLRHGRLHLRLRAAGEEPPVRRPRTRSRRSRSASCARTSPRWTTTPTSSRSSTEIAKAGYDYATEFEFGLDLILDALERYRTGA